MKLSELRKKWEESAEAYKVVEIGGGVHNFVNDVLSHPELFALKLTPKKTTAQQIYVHDTEAEKHGRPDFVFYVNKDITIPCEVKCYTRISEGLKQLQRYRSDYTKEYGLLTDGFEWRFYRSNSYEIWTLDQMLESPKLFRTFWENYLKPESYYAELFQPSGQRVLFDDPLDLNDLENREIFFKETSRLIANFRTRIRIQDDKTALETAYAYLIQFILYKVLVDNRFQRFATEYERLRRQVVKAIQDKDLYNLVVSRIRDISEYISQNIYRPFAAEQAEINDKLIADLRRDFTIHDIAPWLDIIAFINKFDFSNLKNEIFGFVYENYLKDLYGEKNKGQFFTDPAVVNFMLDELGYTTKELAKDIAKISIIDPACGAGTFLYSAVDRIIETFGRDGTKKEAVVVKELVDKNVFGLDIAEFPLFLAEMCILLRQLPLTVAPLYDSPVENKLKLFKTKDSISEFLDANIGTQNKNTDWQKFFLDTDLGHPSFMRDNKDLQEMIESMQGHNGQRFRFDYVIGNPPYIGYNECAKQGIEFVKKIQDKKNVSMTMGNVFGVNLNTVPGVPKPYAPKPNLYAFFMALGLALLKDNGKLCYIIPQTLLTSGDLDVLRYHLAKHTTIDKIITFGGNLFVDRGVETKRPIITSSLIIIVTKKEPKPNHRVKIVNFLEYTGQKRIELQAYLNSRNKTISSVQQSKLADSIENWNFIKYDTTVLQLLEKYNALNFSIEEYRLKSLKNYDEVQFDKGLVFDKATINTGSEDWLLPNRISRCFRIGTGSGFIATKNIRLPLGSQGLKIFENKYKIIWRYMNPDRFYYSDEKIMIDFNWVVISSKNKNEILFLFSLLNSELSKCILGLYLKSANEKALQIGVRTVKKFLRIPKITPKNQKLKDKIVALTESMLSLEDVMLRDIVDFGRLSVQSFDSICVVGNELILTNCKDFHCNIQESKAELVQKIVRENYQKDGLLTQGTITLQELKTLPTIDFDKQAKIKKEIDDLVYALYFDVAVANVMQHEFYDDVHS